VRAKTMRFTSQFHVDGSSPQRLLPRRGQRFEGVAFSPSGMSLGVATADGNEVLLYRREAGGKFESSPYCSLGGSNSTLKYPHDVAFSRTGNTELLAVAHRAGKVAIYARSDEHDNFQPSPTCEIAGSDSGLDFSDAVTFVPPNDDYLAVCNLQTSALTFYARLSQAPEVFQTEPTFLLTHPSLNCPDGLAFSQCGTWLAVANHGNHTVTIFQRSHRIQTGNGLKFEREPITIIQDPQLRHPHSVAFTPRGRLIVTSAGANFLSVYEPRKRSLSMGWSQLPSFQLITGLESSFRIINALNKMEGGPKGVAVHCGQLAVCSPEFGLKIFNFSERWHASTFIEHLLNRRARQGRHDGIRQADIRDEEFDFMRSATEALRNSVDDLQRANALVHGQMADLREYAISLARSRDEAVNYAQDVERERDEAIGYATSLRAACDEAVSYANSLERSIEEHRSSAAEAARFASSLQLELEKVTHDFKEAQSEHEKSRSEAMRYVHSLEEEIDRLRKTQG
jgi:hypothetical protein